MPIIRNFYSNDYRIANSLGNSITAKNGVLYLKVIWFYNQVEIDKLPKDQIAIIKDNTLTEIELAVILLHDYMHIKIGHPYTLEVYDSENLFNKTSFCAVFTSLDRVIPLKNKQQIYYFSGAKISTCDYDSYGIF